jgi:hypothetical protein
MGQDCLVQYVFQNVMSKVVQDMEYVETYVDGLDHQTSYSSYT